MGWDAMEGKEPNRFERTGPRSDYPEDDMPLSENDPSENAPAVSLAVHLALDAVRVQPRVLIA